MAHSGPSIPPVPPGNFVLPGEGMMQVRYRYTYPQGQLYWSSLWYSILPPQDGEFESGLNWPVLQNRWPFLLGHLCTTGITLVMIEQLQYEISTGELIYYDTFDCNVPGFVPTSAAPPQDCVMIQLVGPYAGRSGRGRLYLSGWYADLAVNGRINPLVYDNVRNVLIPGITATLPGLDNAGQVFPMLRPAIPNRGQGGAWQARPFNPLPISVARLDPIIRSQRGRQLDKPRHNVS